MPHLITKVTKDKVHFRFSGATSFLNRGLLITAALKPWQSEIMGLASRMKTTAISYTEREVAFESVDKRVDDPCAMAPRHLLKLSIPLSPIPNVKRCCDASILREESQYGHPICLPLLLKRPAQAPACQPLGSAVYRVLAEKRMSLARDWVEDNPEYEPLLFFPFHFLTMLLTTELNEPSRASPVSIGVGGGLRIAPCPIGGRRVCMELRYILFTHDLTRPWISLIVVWLLALFTVPNFYFTLSLKTLHFWLYAAHLT